MANEWLKIEINTLDKPEVLRISRILGIERDDTFGKLVRLWAWFDRNSVDGVVDGVVDADVDDICKLPGFAAACIQVGWLAIDKDAETVTLPNFSRHNGETAKKRALKNERQAKWRSGKPENVDRAASTRTSTPASTSASTREEKRRSTTPLKPPQATKRKKPGTPCPTEFEVTPEMASWAVAMGLDEKRITAETESFLDHHTAKGTLFSDWSAAWRTWIRNAVKFAAGKR